MMRYVTVVLVLMVAACKSQLTSGQLEQGIAGEVWWLEGDFMPRIGEKPSGQRKPVRREVVFYEVVSLGELDQESGPVFPAIPGKEVASVNSGDDGKFKVMLPEGTYSVFTKEPEGFFANSFDGEGQVNAVTVRKGEVTQMAIEINYQATY